MLLTVSLARPPNLPSTDASALRIEGRQHAYTPFPGLFVDAAGHSR
jgi:hypothetical protein